jgi:hypothetical protein
MSMSLPCSMRSTHIANGRNVSSPGRRTNATYLGPIDVASIRIWLKDQVT